MVEASLVYPLVILSIAATMMILAFLLVEGIAQIHVHNGIRCEVGKQTETYSALEKKDGTENIAFSKSFGGLHTILTGQQDIVLDGAGLLPPVFQKTIIGHGFLIDEQKYARYMDLFLSEEPDDE